MQSKTRRCVRQRRKLPIFGGSFLPFLRMALLQEVRSCYMSVARSGLLECFDHQAVLVCASHLRSLPSCCAYRHVTGFTSGAFFKCSKERGLDASRALRGSTGRVNPEAALSETDPGILTVNFQDARILGIPGATTNPTAKRSYTLTPELCVPEETQSDSGPPAP